MMYSRFDPALDWGGAHSVRMSTAVAERSGHPDQSPESILDARDAAAADTLDETTFDARMLYVEDDETIADVIGIMLEDLGFDVTHAISGEMALGLLEGDRTYFDIVMTDVVMAGISGVSLAKKIRGFSPDLPVILASGYSDEIVGGYRSDFELIRKPFSRRELIACLRRHLKA